MEFGVRKPTLKALAKIPAWSMNNDKGAVFSKRILFEWSGATLRDLEGQEFSALGSSSAM